MSKKRVIVVTGGGSGMGRAIARKFAANGDVVYVLGRHLEKLQETAKDRPSIYPIEADLSVVKSVEKAAERIIGEHTNVDVLVNNAGGIIKVDDNDTLTAKLEKWRTILSINLETVFLTTTAFLPHIVRPGGRVINITSTAALVGSTGGGIHGQAYAAAKSAIHGYSRTLLYALGKEGITINCVSPGVVDETEFFTKNGVPEDRKLKYLERIPIGRLGKPAEIAEAVFYIASPKSGFVTGEILNINGGMVLGR